MYLYALTCLNFHFSATAFNAIIVLSKPDHQEGHLSWKKFIPAIGNVVLNVFLHLD